MLVSNNNSNNNDNNNRINSGIIAHIEIGIGTL